MTRRVTSIAKFAIPGLAAAFLLSLAATAGLAQQASEGYIRTADGVRLFYKIVGSGPETLVAVHGGPGNSLESILPDFEPLAKKRRIIYYDQRGNGRSDLIKDPEKLAIAKHVEDLETVRTHFKLDKLTLLGNSWGGLLVGWYAVKHPDKVERMILHCPKSVKREYEDQMQAEIQSRIDQRYNAEQRKRLGYVATSENWIKAKDPRAYCREFYMKLLAVYVDKPDGMKLFKGDVCAGPEESIRYQLVVNALINRSVGDWNLVPSLGVVKAPTLVIHGTSDVIPVKSSEAWARALPNGQLLLIKGSGHIPQIEQPEIFFKAVEIFLDGGSVPDAKTVN